MASKTQLMRKFSAVAASLMNEGYDQALSEMLDELDIVSGEYGVDFHTHLVERVDPDLAPRLVYRKPKRG